MSKSKGNVVTPMGLLEEHGSDAVRYWAARGGPGVDTAFDPGQMKIGRRLAIKLLNASRFVLTRTEPVGPVTEALDAGMLAELADVVATATRHFEAYDYAAALRETETFFWAFCDDYIELAKRRRAGDDGAAASANAAAQAALTILVRLFAPFLPFVTEEVWSWWHRGSVHRADWPTPDEALAGLAVPEGTTRELYARARAVTALVRHERSTQKLGFGRRVRARLELGDLDEAGWRAIERDVLEGNNIVSPASVRLAAGETRVSITPEPADA
jgi:valyl-tRNA synthetase